MSLLDQQKEVSTYSYSGNALLAGNYGLLSTNSFNTWIIDNGVTDHMCRSLDMFDTYKIASTDNNFITIPDGSKIQITHTGTIKLNNFIELNNVLYVPIFKFNLNYVHKLCKDNGLSVQFTSDICYVQGPS